MNHVNIEEKPTKHYNFRKEIQPTLQTNNKINNYVSLSSVSTNFLNKNGGFEVVTNLNIGKST